MIGKASYRLYPVYDEEEFVVFGGGHRSGSVSVRRPKWSKKFEFQSIYIYNPVVDHI